MGDNVADKRSAILRRFFCLSADECLCGHFHGRAFPKAPCFLLRSQERAHFELQRLIARAGLAQEIYAFARRMLQRGLQKATDLFPALRVHRLPAGDWAELYRCPTKTLRQFTGGCSHIHKNQRRQGHLSRRLTHPGRAP